MRLLVARLLVPEESSIANPSFLRCSISSAVPHVDMTQGQREIIDDPRLPTLGNMEKLGNSAIDTASKVTTEAKPHANNELGFAIRGTISEPRAA